MATIYHAAMPEGFGEKLGIPKMDRDHLDHLVEQLSFLDDSCAAYDGGKKAEAKRLATTVRVLLHDTGTSTSLLTHLSVKEKIKWTDGIVHEFLKNLIEEQEKGNRGSMSLLTTVKLGAGFLEDYGLVQQVPVFEIQELGKRWTSFDYWWTTNRIVDEEFNPLSRKQIVLWMANTDGGAHIGKMAATYRSVSRESSMGVTLSKLAGKTKADDSPLPAAMRQIAEEVRFSIREQLDHFLKIKNHMDENNY